MVQQFFLHTFSEEKPVWIKKSQSTYYSFIAHFISMLKKDQGHMEVHSKKGTNPLTMLNVWKRWQIKNDLVQLSSYGPKKGANAWNLWWPWEPIRVSNQWWVFIYVIFPSFGYHIGKFFICIWFKTQVLLISDKKIMITSSTRKYIFCN